MNNNEIIHEINEKRIKSGQHTIQLSERKDSENYKDTIKAMDEARADERAKICKLLGKAWEEEEFESDIEIEIIADFIEPLIKKIEAINR